MTGRIERKKGGQTNRQAGRETTAQIYTNREAEKERGRQEWSSPFMKAEMNQDTRLNQEAVIHAGGHGQGYVRSRRWQKQIMRADVDKYTQQAEGEARKRRRETGKTKRSFRGPSDNDSGGSI